MQQQQRPAKWMQSNRWVARAAGRGREREWKRERVRRKLVRANQDLPLRLRVGTERAATRR